MFDDDNPYYGQKEPSIDKAINSSRGVVKLRSDKISLHRNNSELSIAKPTRMRSEDLQNLRKLSVSPHR